MATIHGDLTVDRTLKCLRANESLVTEVLTGDYQAIVHDNAWKRFDAGGSDRIVSMPDATTLENGWKIVIQNMGSAGNLDVRKYDPVPVSGALLKTIEWPVAANDTTAYQMVLLDNSTAAGVWYVVELGDTSMSLQAARFVVNFLSTDFPAAVNDYRILTSVQAPGLDAFTHGRGRYPNIQLQEKVSTDWDLTWADYTRSSSGGDVSIRVTDGAEFDGRVVLI